MMKRAPLWAAAVALPFATAALAQSPNVATTPGTPMSTNTMARGGATTTTTTGAAQPVAAADRTFVNKAAQSGLAEVQEGQLAQQQAQNDKVKQFGQQMVSDHTKANEQLMQIASTKGLTPPTTPSAEQQRQLSKLQGLNGAKFDKTFAKGQVKDHQDTIEVFQAEINNGKDPDLKNYAQQTLPVLQNHLQEAQNLR